MNNVLGIVKASHRGMLVSPRKLSLLITNLRGRSVSVAMDYLQFSRRSAAPDVSKLLKSCIANAKNKSNLNIDDLVISSIYVSAAPTLKRFRARARGRGNRILKRRSNLYMFLDYSK